MNIVVTGGAGFIASHIVDELIERGHRVAVIDNLSTGKRENVHPLSVLYKMDITDPQVANIFEAFQPEVVIHHAAQNSVAASMTNPLLDATSNITGSIHLLELCKLHSVRKVIYASSAAVYGQPQKLGIGEEHLVRPTSCYGISKHTVEHYIEVYSQLYHIDYTILRYANVYGMRQDPHGEGGIISVFMDKWLTDKTPTIYGDGEQTRDFIFVKDVVQANIEALTQGSRSLVNIGTNLQTSVNELVRILNRLFGEEIVPIYKSKRPGDIDHSRLDNRLARKQLSWSPRYTLEEGLEETIVYYSK